MNLSHFTVCLKACHKINTTSHCTLHDMFIPKQDQTKIKYADFYTLSLGGHLIFKRALIFPLSVCIAVLHVTYYPVNKVDCSNPIKKKCDYNLSSQFVHSVTNVLVPYWSITAFCWIIELLYPRWLNRLHMAMITVLNTGSHLLFGVNR